MFFSDINSIISLTSLTYFVSPNVFESNNSLVSLCLVAYSFAREPLEHEY